jgi:DNA modification methylase
MCGSATEPGDVALLMDGAKADMVFTDPPYGIEHSGAGIEGQSSANDFGEMLGDEDVEIAKAAYKLTNELYPESAQVFWGANYYASILKDGYGWIVWDKQREGDTFSGAELAYTNRGVRLDVFRHQWHGMIKASEHGEARVHPTQKPVALSAWLIKNYGKGDTLLDLFGGSGSTLIACEQTNRICYMMELDPRYVDVIRKRYAKHIGEEESWLEVTPSVSQPALV